MAWLRAVIVLLLMSSTARSGGITTSGHETSPDDSQPAPGGHSGESTWMKRPMPHPRPPPPPDDDRAAQQRAIVAALTAAQPAVQRCADRFDMWSDRVDVRVSVGSRGSAVTVTYRIGGQRFVRCVQRELEPQVAAASGRRLPMTFSHVFAVRHRRSGYAQPPSQ